MSEYRVNYGFDGNGDCAIVDGLKSVDEVFRTISELRDEGYEEFKVWKEIDPETDVKDLKAYDRGFNDAIEKVVKLIRKNKLN